jgi:serine/threonine protein kinase
MIGQSVSHYKILEHLGGGGMGVVYKAQDLRLDRLVALKFLPPELTRDPEAKQRFVNEAKAASALQHNNICVAYDIDETDDGRMFISMEYLEGETLKEEIDRGPLKFEEAVDIAIQVTHGSPRLMGTASSTMKTQLFVQFSNRQHSRRAVSQPRQCSASSQHLHR